MTPDTPSRQGQDHHYTGKRHPRAIPKRLRPECDLYPMLAWWNPQRPYKAVSAIHRHRTIIDGCNDTWEIGFIVDQPGWPISSDREDNMPGRGGRDVQASRVGPHVDIRCRHIALHEHLLSHT